MRCQRLTVIVAVLISSILNFGLGLQKADAGSCKALGLANGCVTTKDVRNNTLKAVDMRDEPGADFASGFGSFPLESAPETVRSVTITAPRPGVVIVNASGFFAFNDTAGQAECSITTGPTPDGNHRIIAEGDANTNFIPFAGTRGFTVAKGSTTFNLVCQELSGDVYVDDPSITAIYVPTRY